MARSKQVLRNGKWEEGSASPELLRDDLRSLPGEYVTKDIAEPNKIHELDPQHVVNQILDDKVTGKDSSKLDDKEKPRDPEFDEVPPGQTRELYQKGVDVVRLRVLKSLVERQILRLKRGANLVDLKVRHLWFPENNLNHYELRTGNPPPDSERPKHMRGFRLELDVLHLPQSIVDYCEARGESIDVPAILTKALVK